MGGQAVRPRLTLSSPTLGVIIAPGNLPLCLVVHFRHQHDCQISTTCRGALLGSGSQQSCGATGQEIRRRIVVRLLDIPHSNDTQLLMGFVVGACRDPKCRLWLSALDVHRIKQSGMSHFSRCRAIVLSIREVIVDLENAGSKKTAMCTQWQGDGGELSRR